MRIGIVGGGPGVRLVDLVEQAKRAWRDGLSSFWLSPQNSTDPLTAIAVIGGAVPGLQFGVSISPSFLRHPMSLAVLGVAGEGAFGGRAFLERCPLPGRNL